MRVYTAFFRKWGKISHIMIPQDEVVAHFTAARERYAAMSIEQASLSFMTTVGAYVGVCVKRGFTLDNACEITRLQVQAVINGVRESCMPGGE